MNYIQQLEQDKLVLTAATQAALIGLADLMSYLHSEKFHEDPTVQVQDVVNRINEIRTRVYDAGANA